MKIKVTEKHIQAGEPENENYCPVALAIREQVKNSNCVEVNLFEINFLVGDKPFSFFTTAEIDVFIEDFDDGKKVNPFEFELELEAKTA